MFVKNSLFGLDLFSFFVIPRDSSFLPQQQMGLTFIEIVTNDENHHSV